MRHTALPFAAAALLFVSQASATGGGLLRASSSSSSWSSSIVIPESRRDKQVIEEGGGGHVVQGDHHPPETAAEGVDSHGSSVATGHEDAHGHGTESGGHHEGGHGNHNIFTAGGVLLPLEVSAFMVFVIFISLLLELGFHSLDHAVDKSTKRLIQQTHKELSLLGLLSFTLFMIQTFIGDQLNPRIVLCFEYAHVLIFFMALIYIIQSGLLIASVNKIRRQLERCLLPPKIQGGMVSARALVYLCAILVLVPVHGRLGDGADPANSVQNHLPALANKAEAHATEVVEAHHGEAGHGAAAGHGGEHGGHGHGHEEDHNIFTAGSKLDKLQVSAFMAFVIMVSLIIESGFHFLDHSVDKNSRKLIQQMHKELSLLGLLSFALFMVQTFVGAKLSHSLLMCFEYAHVLVFFMALIYIMQSALLIASVKRLRKDFERLNTDTEYDSKHKHLAFKTFRSFFLQVHNLPQNFLFDRYLTVGYNFYVLEALEITREVWLCLVLLLGLDVAMGFGKFGATQSFLSGSWTFPLYGLAIFAFDLLLYWAVMNAHKKLRNKLVTDMKDDHASEQSMRFTGVPRLAMESSRSLRDRREHFEAEHAQDEEKAKELMAGIRWNFVLHNKKSFKLAMDTLSLVNCLYLASYFTSYICEAIAHQGVYSVVTIVLAPLPSLVSILYLNPSVLAKYMLIKSATEIDVEVLDDVVEYMEAVESVFERIAQKLKENGEKDGECIMKNFRAFDTNGDGTLSHAEFKKGLRDWGLKVTRSQMHALIRFVDSDFSGSIAMEEFSGLLAGKDVFAKGRLLPVDESKFEEAEVVEYEEQE